MKSPIRFNGLTDREEKAVFFGRCIPIIRSLISIPAGMARMKLPVFTLFTVAGSLIWDTVLVTLGGGGRRIVARTNLRRRDTMF